jgi:zinc protease
MSLLSRAIRASALLVVAGLAWTAGLAAQDAPVPEIPFQSFELENGLRLVVHEDDKAPIVAVNVWYHVGSKNEKPGKTGFAHLFEHLMFNGTENYDDDYFKPFERAGATDMNGTTNVDRTNYFQNVPAPALDLALWMESDRMGHLLGAVDQAKLDEQRGVVQNEKRQGENQPYGIVRQLIAPATHPDEHPYSWTTIGSMEDLDAASLEDVHEWFETYYGPNNAVIVVAGDVDAGEVHERVKHYFGAIPAGPPVAKHRSWVPKMEGTKRQVVQDRVPQARLYKVWNVPEWGSRDADLLDMVTDVLASGKNSRLYKRLVYDDQIATNVSAFVWQRELGSQLRIVATARPGQELAEVEKAVDEEVARLLEEGPTREELDRVKTSKRAGFLRGIERIGGFGGKSDVLAEHAVYAGDPGYYRARYERMAAATTADLRDVARRWISDGVYVLEVHPYPEYGVAGEDADRAQLPEPGEVPEATFPGVQRATLSNGLEVVLAERHSVPLVEMSLHVDAGYAADQFGIPGTADLALDMMDEGTASRSALEISAELDRLGAELGTGSNLDVSTVSLSALRENLDASLELFADVVLNPAFPEADFRRLKQQQMAGIQREKVQPVAMALRVFPALLYGEDHAYSNPLTGSGTEESLARITREDLREFHRTWFRPNHATIVAAGAITMEELRTKLERRFGDWERGDVPEKNVGEVAHHDRSKVYLLHRPEAQQSVIFAGHVAPPRANPREVALEAMNTILGGSFTSRLNMNLREEKHWSYGAFSLLYPARGQRPFIVYAPVQTDRTAESLREIVAELRGIQGQEPISDDELQKVKDQETRGAAGRFETLGALEGALSEIVRFGLSDDHPHTYGDEVLALKLDDVSTVATDMIRPDRLVWVVVGDREKIEPGIRELGLGEIQRIDADGRPLAAD